MSGTRRIAEADLNISVLGSSFDVDLGAVGTCAVDRRIVFDQCHVLLTISDDGDGQVSLDGLEPRLLKHGSKVAGKDVGVGGAQHRDTKRQKNTHDADDYEHLEKRKPCLHLLHTGKRKLSRLTDFLLLGGAEKVGGPVRGCSRVTVSVGGI